MVKLTTYIKQLLIRIMISVHPHCLYWEMHNLDWPLIAFEPEKLQEQPQRREGHHQDGIPTDLRKPPVKHSRLKPVKNLLVNAGIRDQTCLTRDDPQIHFECLREELKVLYTPFRRLLVLFFLE
mmetsp:Transcript_20911/g.27021  ORF Transcript_20911/g.27021 Transcript_20911/m.27021 type:complete len:124 (+) Transcript_20911:513-884(+)